MSNMRVHDTKRSIGSFRNAGSHHPGAGVGPPSRAIACPSQPEAVKKSSNRPGPVPLGQGGLWRLDVFRAPLLRSGGEVPRSDSGRAAARAWSETRPENPHSHVSGRICEFMTRSARLDVSATPGRTTPAMAWDRRPAPSPAPPQPRRGTKTSNLQGPPWKRGTTGGFWGWLPPETDSTTLTPLKFPLGKGGTI